MAPIVLEESKTTWTTLAVFTLGAYFLSIAANRVAHDPPSIQGSDDDGVNDSIIVSSVEKLTPVEEVREKFETSLSVAPWAKKIDILLSLWLAIIVIYPFTLLCRRSGADDGEYLYRSPPFWNPWIFVSLIFVFLFNIGYVICLGLERMGVAMMFAILTALKAAVTLTVSAVNLNRTLSDLIKLGFYKDILFNIGIVQNGPAALSLAAFVTSLEQFNAVMVYEAEMEDQTATTTCYSILFICFIVYFSLDNFLFTRSMRYIFAPYIALIWLLLGVLMQQWETVNASSSYCLVLMFLAVMALVAKTILSINRARDEPTLREGYEQI